MKRRLAARFAKFAIQKPANAPTSMTSARSDKAPGDGHRRVAPVVFVEIEHLPLSFSQFGVSHWGAGYRSDKRLSVRSSDS